MKLCHATLRTSAQIQQQRTNIGGVNRATAIKIGGFTWRDIAKVQQNNSKVATSNFAVAVKVFGAQMQIGQRKSEHAICICGGHDISVVNFKVKNC